MGSVHRFAAGSKGRFPGVYPGLNRGRQRSQPHCWQRHDDAIDPSSVCCFQHPGEQKGSSAKIKFGWFTIALAMVVYWRSPLKGIWLSCRDGATALLLSASMLLASACGQGVTLVGSRAA